MPWLVWKDKVVINSAMVTFLEVKDCSVVYHLVDGGKWIWRFDTPEDALQHLTEFHYAANSC